MSNLCFFVWGKDKYCLGWGYMSTSCTVFSPPVTDVLDAARL